MADLRIGPIDHLLESFKPPEEVPHPRSREPQGVSFGSLIKQVVGEAIEAEAEASKAIEDFANGTITDIHDVVVAVNKANLAVELLVQIRNRLLEAYQELAKIQM